MFNLGKGHSRGQVRTSSDADFRAAAVMASEAMLRLAKLPHGSSPSEAGVSYCIAAPSDPAGIVGQLKVIVLVCVVLGFGGLAAGGVLAAHAGNDAKGHGGVLAVIAGCCIAGGMMAMFLPTAMEGWLSARHIRRHVGDFWAT